MLSINMLNVIVRNAIMLSVVMLNVVSPLILPFSQIPLRFVFLLSTRHGNVIKRFFVTGDQST